jgi:hypothetical protein
METIIAFGTAMQPALGVILTVFAAPLQRRTTTGNRPGQNRGGSLCQGGDRC